MKLFIIEDERLGLERLTKMLLDINPGFEILGHAETIKSAVYWLQNHPAPDLIFMDIELADGQCFEIFKQVEVLTPIIFTTSYDEYALNAFKVNSIDYLLKPIRKEELEQSILKYEKLKTRQGAPPQQFSIEKLIEGLTQAQPKNYRSRFLVKQGQRWLTIETSDIAWFMADGRICFLRTWDNQRFIVDYTLEEIGEMLDPLLFFRVNRSYITHARAVKSFQPYFNGKLILSLQPATEQNDVVISKEKAGDFKKWMGK